MVIGTSIVISFLLPGLLQLFSPIQSLSGQILTKLPVSVTSTPSDLPLAPIHNLQPSIGEVIEEQCREVPVGVGIPGFQPGIPKDDVLRTLGAPSQTSSGYWPNTKAIAYQLVPDQVSLGFLFDKKSELIRQTEASFAPVVELKMIVVTLDGMLGCQLNEPIKQGLQKVRSRQSSRYSFTLGSLKGVIERDRSDRIYIGIWEADLH